mmetsp:Transcript_126762/g.248456  ORF Transcript_126762/g.248456 Transcript_126762/m.248456 type:complete len:237 (-) Transcript_126762:2-712(-)
MLLLLPLELELPLLLLLHQELLLVIGPKPCVQLRVLPSAGHAPRAPAFFDPLPATIPRLIASRLFRLALDGQDLTLQGVARSVEHCKRLPLHVGARRLDAALPGKACSRCPVADHRRRIGRRAEDARDGAGTEQVLVFWRRLQRRPLNWCARRIALRIVASVGAAPASANAHGRLPHDHRHAARHPARGSGRRDDRRAVARRGHAGGDAHGQRRRGEETAREQLRGWRLRRLGRHR